MRNPLTMATVDGEFRKVKLGERAFCDNFRYIVTDDESEKIVGVLEDERAYYIGDRVKIVGDITGYISPGIRRPGFGVIVDIAILDVTGKLIDVNVGRFDYSKYFKDEGITDSLVQYDEGSNTVTVDSRASDSYAKYAAIHECICVGRCKSLFPIGTDERKRCGEIDKMLISLMPEAEREAYIQKRIEMFETLLDRNLRPDLNETFKMSIQLLKGVKK